MPLKFRSFIIFLWCLTYYALLSAQPGDQQINNWIKTLSQKKDPRGNSLELITHEISVTYSATLCNTIDRIKLAAKESNIRGQIRTKIILHLLQRHGIKCNSDQSSLDLLGEALQAAYEIEDEALQYEIHLRLGQIYNGMKQYGLATMHYHMLFDILRRSDRPDFFLSATVLYDMSYSLY